MNDTAAKLLPCITETDLMNHLQAFEDIAIANPGPDGHPSRNSGEPGYRASVQYVANVMQQAGYNVTIQPYTFNYYACKSLPTLSEVSPTSADFSGFVPGRIALIQRGSCNFGVKIQNAEAAGASGVIIFNEGNPGRTDVIVISIIDANGNSFIPTIPVA